MHCRACERRWGERSTEAITSLQSLLVISLLLWKRTRMVWAGAMCSRQTDREKAWCDSSAQKASAISQGFGSAAAPLGTGSTRISDLCSVCQASSYPQILKHWTCHSEDAGAFTNPRASTFWFFAQEDEAFEVLSGFVNASLKGALCGTLWGFCLNAIKSSSKLSNFLQQMDRKKYNTD